MDGRIVSGVVVPLTETAMFAVLLTLIAQVDLARYNNDHCHARP
jgi:hypothetical protein